MRPEGEVREGEADSWSFKSRSQAWDEVIRSTALISIHISKYWVVKRSNAGHQNFCLSTSVSNVPNRGTSLLLRGRSQCQLQILSAPQTRCEHPSISDQPSKILNIINWIRESPVYPNYTNPKHVHSTRWSKRFEKAAVNSPP